MDNENTKLAHESITTIVRSAIDKGNMTPAQIAELTQNLKNVFLPTVDVQQISRPAPIVSQKNTVDGKPAASNEVVAPDDVVRPRITFQQLQDGRQEDLEFCKSGAIILDPENTFDDDFIVCLEDLTKMKILKSRLKNVHHLSPDEYREKWGLPKDYKLSTASVAAQRKNNVETRKENIKNAKKVIAKSSLSGS